MVKPMHDMGASTRSVTAMPVPPLLIHPVAASAAVTAIGMGLAVQMMGVFAGSLQGAFDASRRFGLPVAHAVPEQPPVAVDDVEPDTGVSPSGAAASRKPAARQKAAAPAARRTATQKAGRRASTPRNAVGSPAAARKAGRQVGKRPAEMARPETPDDLKRIPGIGPKLEQVLNGLGIWTFSQIATLTAAESRWLDDHLGLAGRIGKDEWQARAAALAGNRQD